MSEQVPFFSLNKRRDWEKGRAFHIELTDEGLRLEREERFGWTRNIALHGLDWLEAVEQMAAAEGKLLLLDRAGNLWVYDDRNGDLERLLRAGHDLFTPRALLTAVADVVVVADARAEHRITGYSLSNGQAVWSWSEWKGAELHPLAAGTDGESAYVLTRFEGAEAGVDAGVDAGANPPAAVGVMRFDAQGRVRKVFTHPDLDAGGGQGRFFLTVSAEGKMHVLQASDGTVLTFAADGELLSRFALSGEAVPSGLAADRQGFLYVGDGRRLKGNREDDRFLVQWSPLGERKEQVSGYRGRADRLVGDVSGGTLYVYNSELQQITVLDLKTRTKMFGGAGLHKGIYLTRALDSTEAETVWHKIQLEADLPEETQLQVSFYASDRKLCLLNGRYEDLDEFLQDRGRAEEETLQALAHLWSEPMVNPKDALLVQAQGRYLWLKVEWSGSEVRSPLLRRLRAFFPRTSYVDELPAVYQQDAASRDFLERFLSLYGTFYAEMEERIDRVSRYLDVESTPQEFLSWLGSWLGIAAEEAWSEEQLRELIRKAPRLYQKRGTRQGLAELIEIFIGEKPFLVEYFQYRHLIEQGEIRELMEQLYGLDPYRFCVLLRPESVKSEKQLFLVKKLVEEEKPAFAEAAVVVLEPWIYMGKHAYLGVNTFLAEPNLLVLDEKSSMPYHTVLIDVDQENRIGLHTRLGLDAELDS